MAPSASAEGRLATAECNERVSPMKPTISLPEKARKRSRTEQLHEEVAELAKHARLDSWNSFVEELQVPSDLYPALLTLRPQLLRAVTPRALTADECRALYQCIAGIIETNAALREHAEQVANLTQNWLDAFRGLDSIGRQIVDFAKFRAPVEDNDDDQA